MEFGWVFELQEMASQLVLITAARLLSVKRGSGFYS